MSRSKGVLKRKTLCVLVLVGTQLLAYLSFAQESDLASNSLPSYICGEGSALALFSNKSWVLSNETTRHASQIVKYSWTSCGQQSAYSIWTIPCKEKTQTRRFKRDVVLPGRPATLSYSLHWAGAADNYVVDLFFNDKRVDHSTSPKSSFLLPKTASEKLHLGNNEIEVAVTKKNGKGSCGPSYPNFAIFFSRC